VFDEDVEELVEEEVVLVWAIRPQGLEEDLVCAGGGEGQPGSPVVLR